MDVNELLTILILGVLIGLVSGFVSDRYQIPDKYRLIGIVVVSFLIGFFVL